jgi:hypothetical protein
VTWNLGGLRPKFPNLAASNSRWSSKEDPDYNCIAWAAGVSDIWWEPDAFFQWFWPLGASREYTIRAYLQAYGTQGFIPCDGGASEVGVLKLALYARGALPTHVARQLPDGWWASKLGKNVDIEHTLDALDGGEYGNVVHFLKKSTS